MTLIEHQGIKYEDYWYDLKYFRTGRVAHIVSASEFAVCGMYPYHDTWRGTGNQDEREKAESLPLCSKCKQHMINIGHEA